MLSETPKREEGTKAERGEETEKPNTKGREADTETELQPSKTPRSREVKECLRSETHKQEEDVEAEPQQTPRSKEDNTTESRRSDCRRKTTTDRTSTEAEVKTEAEKGEEAKGAGERERTPRPEPQSPNGHPESFPTEEPRD